MSKLFEDMTCDERNAFNEAYLTIHELSLVTFDADERARLKSEMIQMEVDAGFYF